MNYMRLLKNDMTWLAQSVKHTILDLGDLNC